MRCSKKEFCKQCRLVKFKGTMTKWPVYKPTHKRQVEHQDATDIQKKGLCISGNNTLTLIIDSII